MSHYTTQVRNIVEDAMDREGLDHNVGNWGVAYKRLGLAAKDNIMGLQPYPIFDESYRAELNLKIVQHFYMWEIGQETAGLFAFTLNEKMRSIMPYYNQLYKSQDLITEPLVDVHVTETYTRDYTDNSTKVTDQDTSTKEDTTDTHGKTVVGHKTDVTDTDTTVTTNGDGWNHAEGSTNTDTNSREVFEDTPMGMLGNSAAEGGSVLSEGDYATNVTYNKSHEEGTNTDNSSFHNDGTNITDGLVTLNSDSRDTTDATDTRTAKTTGTNDVTVTDSQATHEESKREKIGHTKSQAELLEEYRSTFINIDARIITELESLFIEIW